MRNFFTLIVFLLSLSINSQKNNKSPNIILIMVDDLGSECLESYGGTSYNTPILTKMSKNGMQFKNAHSMPICTPSRVKLMTGKSNKKNHVSFAYLDPKEKTFSQELRSAGYETLIAGKWQLGYDKKLPEYFGFDEHVLWHLETRGRDSLNNDKRYSNPRLVRNGKTYEANEGKFSTDLIVDYINDFINRKKNKPFLIYYPMILTHCPFVPTPHSDDWNPQDLGSKTYKGNAKYFGDMVSYMDFSIGRIIDHVEELGLSENTIIIFTADNGTDEPVVSMKNNIAVPGGKGKTIDSGTHVPLIIKWDGVIEPGILNESLIDFSDFYPTILDISGIKYTNNSDLDGISFYSQFFGDYKSKRNWIYSWYNRSGASSPTDVTYEWVRNETYKFYRGNRFYNVKNDPEELINISWNNMTKEEKSIRENFLDVLNSYNHLRNKLK